jgi:hypothetical protein
MLFKLNDDVTLILETYSGMKSGATRFEDGKAILGALSTGESSSETKTEVAPASAVGGSDLLDLFDSSSPPTHSPHSSGTVTNHMHMTQAAAPPPAAPRVTRVPAVPVPATATVEYDIFGDVIQTSPPRQPQQTQVAAHSPATRSPAVPLLAPPGSKGVGSSGTVAPLLPPPPGAGTGHRERLRTASNPPPVAPVATNAKPVDLFDNDFLVPSPASVSSAAPAQPVTTFDPFDDLSSIASRPVGGVYSVFMFV